MLLMKKIGPCCLLLFTLFAEIAYTPSNVASHGAQVIEEKAELLPHCLETVDARAGIVDSTGYYEYTVHEDGTAEILKYLKKEEEVMIPSQLDGNPVTAIGEAAFEYKLSSVNITIPNSVTKIGDRALGYHGDEKYENISVTGYRYTIAEYYAEVNQIDFRDIESGKVIPYDVSSVPREKIEKLTAGKKKIRLSCKEIERAEYEIAVQRAGSFVWEKYVVFEPSAVIKGLKSGKQYKVKMRAVCTVGATGYGKWSKVKKVTVR